MVFSVAHRKKEKKLLQILRVYLSTSLIYYRRLNIVDICM